MPEKGRCRYSTEKQFFKRQINQVVKNAGRFQWGKQTIDVSGWLFTAINPRNKSNELLPCNIK